MAAVPQWGWNVTEDPLRPGPGTSGSSLSLPWTAGERSLSSGCIQEEDAMASWKALGGQRELHEAGVLLLRVVGIRCIFVD